MIPGAANLAAAAGVPAAASGRIKKAVQIEMLPKANELRRPLQIGWRRRVRGGGRPDCRRPKVAEEIKKASDDAKVPIHSVMNMAHWSNPLSSSDPAVVKKSLDGMKTSLHNAKLWGAETRACSFRRRQR